MTFQKGNKINIGNKYHLGFKHSEESKKRMGRKGRIPFNKGTKLSDEIKNKISNSVKKWHIENKHPFLGKHHSEISSQNTNQ